MLHFSRFETDTQKLIYVAMRWRGIVVSGSLSPARKIQKICDDIKAPAFPFEIVMKVEDRIKRTRTNPAEDYEDIKIIRAVEQRPELKSVLSKALLDTHEQNRKKEKKL